MIEQIKTTSEEHWLGLRAKNLNSTEVPALFGLSPYTTELELYHQKKSGEVVMIEDNDRMLAGRCLESGIALMVSHKLECTVEPFKDYVCDPGARMGSSFDYVITSGEYQGWILEIKNVDYLVYRDNWFEDEAPAHIEVQVQHQLELTERPGAIIACLVGGNELNMIQRKRNEKAGAGIRQTVKQFWEAVDSGTEPAIDFERDYEFLLNRHNKSDETVSFDAHDNSHMNDLLKQYRQIKDAIKTLEKKGSAIKAEVAVTVDNASKIFGDGVYASFNQGKDTPPKMLTITEEMVGTEVQISNGRKGSRTLKVTVDA